MKTHLKKLLMLGVFAIFTGASYGQYINFTVQNTTSDIVNYRFTEVKGPGAGASPTDISLSNTFIINPGQTVVFNSSGLNFAGLPNAFIGFFECIWFPMSLSSIGPGVGNGMFNTFVTLVGSWVVPFLPHNMNNANFGAPQIHWASPTHVVIYY